MSIADTLIYLLLVRLRERETFTDDEIVDMIESLSLCESYLTLATIQDVASGTRLRTQLDKCKQLLELRRKT